MCLSGSTKCSFRGHVRAPSSGQKLGGGGLGAGVQLPSTARPSEPLSWLLLRESPVPP